MHDPDAVAALHAVRVKGASSIEDVVRTSAIADPCMALDVLVAEGLLTRRHVAEQWYFALTPSGAELDARLSAERLGDAAAALAAVYDERFLPVNVRFKELCARWQREGEQIELIERAIEIDEEITEVLGSCAAHAPHLARYSQRLHSSMEEFLDGDSSALVDPIGESYHNTWFELHEDLIATLGRTRSQETD